MVSKLCLLGFAVLISLAFAENQVEEERIKRAEPGTFKCYECYKVAGHSHKCKVVGGCKACGYGWLLKDGEYEDTNAIEGFTCEKTDIDEKDLECKDQNFPDSVMKEVGRPKVNYNTLFSHFCYCKTENCNTAALTGLIKPRSGNPSTSKSGTTKSGGTKSDATESPPDNPGGPAAGGSDSLLSFSGWVFGGLFFSIAAFRLI